MEPGRLEFGPGLNLIVGPNGTGKTRLLEVLTALARGQPLALGAEAVDLSWGAEAGKHRLLAQLQVRWSEPSLADRTPRSGAPGSSLPEFECRWSMSAQLSGPLFPGGRSWEGGGSLRGPQPELLQAQASGQASSGLRSRAWEDLPAKADQVDLRALAELVDPSGPGLLDEGTDVFRALGDPAEGRSPLAPRPPLVSIR